MARFRSFAEIGHIPSMVTYGHCAHQPQTLTTCAYRFYLALNQLIITDWIGSVPGGTIIEYEMVMKADRFFFRRRGAGSSVDLAYPARSQAHTGKYNGIQ
jgi:hypothetical protein